LEIVNKGRNFRLLIIFNSQGVTGMVIAVPKEILPGENRVACVPDVASKLIKSGFQVQVEKDAGLNAGFTNDMYWS
jgi:hypothetical protein